MNTRDHFTTEWDERYHEAVAAFLQALDAGGNPDRQQWVERYPEVAARLEAFFADHDHMNAARGPSGPGVAAWEQPTHSYHQLPLLNDDELQRGAPVEEESGFGSLSTPKGALPLQAMEVNAQIEGLLAHVTVAQTFVNTLDEPIEATYIFPLPDQMAVTRFHMEVAGREIDGVLKERAAARQEYTSAIQQGHRAAITEEERPGVFTMRVGNLMPGEEAVVQLSLVGPLPYSNGEATFRFPLVVAPRYVPGKPLPGPAVGTGTAADTTAVPDASRVTPPTLLPGYPNPVRLALAVDVHPSGIPMRDFRSSLHAVLHAEDGDGVQRIMVQAGERLNRDFILRFRVGEGAVRTALALLPDAGNAKEGTFALTLVPPDATLQVQRPRDIVFILDRSGSMDGWKIVAARRALARMVDTLNDQDRFAVYAFDDRIQTPEQLAGTKLVPASHRNRYWAVEYLNKVTTGGGTEMYQPLDLAAHVLSGGEANRERILVLVTDGQVTNEQQILRGLETRARNLRIFALGIDKAVNEGFLRQLAGLGNGSHEMVESEERLDEVMDHMHRRIANPVLTGLRLEADGFELVPDSLVPGRLPDLFSGAALCIGGRYRGAPQGALVVQARDGQGKPWFATVPARRSHNPAIAPLWARGRVRALEDRFTIAQTGRGEIEKQILQTSLRFGVLCRFTSFVAVDRVKVVNPGGQVQPVTQAVEMPEGWTPGQQYEIMVKIGSGAFGEVYKARLMSKMEPGDSLERIYNDILADMEKAAALAKQMEADTPPLCACPPPAASPPPTAPAGRGQDKLDRVRSPRARITEADSTHSGMFEVGADSLDDAVTDGGYDEILLPDDSTLSASSARTPGLSKKAVRGMKAGRPASRAWFWAIVVTLLALLGVLWWYMWP